MASKSVMPAGYAALLTRVKERVRTAQIKAALSANRELRDSSPSILSLPVTESAGAIGLLASLPWGHNIVLMQKLNNSIRAFGTPAPRWNTAGREAHFSFISNHESPT